MKFTTKRRLRRIGIQFCILLVFLAIIDPLTARIFPGTYSEVMDHFGPARPIAYSDYLPYTTPPNVTISGDPFGTITFNALGYRGPYPQTIEKPNGAFRVLFMGDSFTLGWGVPDEDSLVGQVRSALSAQYPSVEVINAGFHDGFSPDSYYAYLRKEGIALKPDLIVIILYTGNDILDMEDSIWDKVDSTGAPIMLHSNHSASDYLGKFLDPRNFSWNYRVPILRESHLFMATTNLINHYFFPQIGIQLGRFGLPLSIDAAWQRFDIVTRATVQFCASQHIPLAYVAIPLPGTPLDQDIYNPGMEKLVKDELNLPYLTLHDLLKTDYQIPNDGHLNVEGSHIAGVAVTQFLLPYMSGSSF